MQILENSVLKVTVSKRGAALCSIYNKRNRREYLWQNGNEQKPAQISFPLIGKLNNDFYLVKGKSYQLASDGFADSFDFDVAEISEHYVKYMLTANKETIPIYPYNFKITVSYRLAENNLTIKFKVYNESWEIMYFSVGQNLNFGEGLTCLDHVNQGGKEIFDVNNTKEIVLRDIDKIKLKNHENSDEVIITFPDFPVLRLQAVSSEAVSVGLWYGEPDKEDSPQEISDKTHIQAVYPNSKFRAKYTLEIK